MRRGLKIILSYCYIVALFFAVFFNYQNIFAATANHIVISEVASGVNSASNEFVEIYNPTSLPITINSSVFKLKLVNSSNTVSNKTITWTNNTIPAFGYFLFVAGGIGVSADATFSAQLSGTSGVVITNGEDVVIDKLGWGETPPSNAVESEGVTIVGGLPTGKSLERKPGLENPEKGNGEDSDNNLADFAIRNIVEPQNSSSAIEIPEDYVPPQNQNPVAEAGVNHDVFIGTEIQFDGSASSDPDGTINSYLWDFKDGSTSVGVKPKHTFSSIGTFNVILVVTDDRGATGSDTCTVNILEVPVYSTKVLLNEIFPAPNSSYDWDGNGVADVNDEWIELINLDDGQIDLGGWTLDDIADGGSDPYTIPANTKIDPDGFKVFYKKDTGLVLNNTGDSVILKNPNDEIVDQYSFTTTLSNKSFSRNDNSSASSWVSNYPPSLGRLNIAQGNNPPVANAGSSINNAKTGETLNFNGFASSDSDGTITSYEWNFGDGSIASGAQVTHSYSTTGTYQVSLTVHDNSGATSTSFITVTVVAGEIQYQNDYSTDIKITEILPDPVGSDTENEYIKIYNFGTRDVNLRNWSLDDENGGSKPFKIDYDLILKPKTVATFYSADTKISLNNTGDHARLFDPDVKIMDDITYSGPVIEGAIYALENGKWSWKNTIASANDDSQTKKDTVPVPAPAENKDTLLKTEIKIPDVKKIAVLEPPVATNQNLTKKNEIPKAQTIGEITTTSGILVFSISKETKPAVQQDLVSPDLSETESVSQKPYQKPVVVFSSMAVSLLLITKVLLRSEDWKKIFKKLFENDEAKNDLENLFK